MHRWLTVVRLLLLGSMLIGAAPALALAPVGACCFANGSCQDLIDSACSTQGGSFIGFGTLCATVDCAAPLAAPMLSVFGIVAAVGALAALGVGALFRRRRG